MSGGRRLRQYRDKMKAMKKTDCHYEAVERNPYFPKNGRRVIRHLMNSNIGTIKREFPELEIIPGRMIPER